MGWLRDSMRQSRSPHRSFGAVARAALEHPAWPKDTKAQARSLASLLSKLDRGIELQWLADRPAVQEVLADVLGTAHSRIQEATDAVLSQSEDFKRRLRLEDVQYATPLDLADEPLPPGIPELVLRPSAWDRPLWWVAPSGSGRSLSGSWLAARHLAAFVSKSSLAEAVRELPRDRACFVEVWSNEGDRLLEPPVEKLCVAAPFPPDARVGGSWAVVQSPQVAQFASALVKWVALRLPRDGQFQPALAEEWLEAAALRGEVDGLGAALGLLGVIDQYGTAELVRRGVAKMADRFVRDRLAELRRTGVLDAAWLTEAAPELLGELMKRALTGSRLGWDEPRPLDEWVELIPSEHQGSLDAEWLRASVARAKSPPTARELDRALQELAPGPFRIVRAFEQAGLLRRKHGSDLLALGPRWLGRHLADSAKAKIADGVPAEWSEALLAPHASAPTARALFARALTGDLSLLEDALEQIDERDPATVAALEMAFRIAGLSTLAGVEVPEDVAFALWEQQMALVVELEDGPHPRLGYGSFTNDEPLLDVGTFRLAAMALSETLPPQRGMAHSALRPFTATVLGPAMTALDSIYDVVRKLDPQATAWARGAYGLSTRARAAIAENARQSNAPASRRHAPAEPPPHPLEKPDRILSAIAGGELRWKDVADAPPELVSALLAIAGHTGTDLRTIAAAFWSAWARDPEPLHDHSPLSPSGPHWRRFYSSAPAAALEVLFGRGLVTREKVPYALFDETAWRGVLGARPDAVSGVPAAWAAMPPSILREALRSTTPGEDDLRRAWERAPEIVMGAVDDAVDRDDPFAANLLATAPAERTAEIVRRLSGRLLGATWLRRRQTKETRRWLAERIAQRSTGWREAFDFLTELEQTGVRS